LLLAHQPNAFAKTAAAPTTLTSDGRDRIPLRDRRIVIEKLLKHLHLW
jgi:hypothetical protein